MALYFSAWLRDTARLYARYMAAASSTIPFAFAAALAKRAGWHDRFVLALALVFGVGIAFAIWRWMGDWQLKPRVAVSPFEAEWADLLKNAVGTGELLQYRVTIDENALCAWQDATMRAFGYDETRTVELTLSLANETAKRMLTFNHDDVLQRMMLGSTQLVHIPQSQAVRRQPNIPVQVSPVHTLLYGTTTQPLMLGSQ